MNLPRNWLVIKDEREDASVVQLGYRHTSLLKQLDGWKNGGDGKGQHAFVETVATTLEGEGRVRQVQLLGARLVIKLTLKG